MDIVPWIGISWVGTLLINGWACFDCRHGLTPEHRAARGFCLVSSFCATLTAVALLHLVMHPHDGMARGLLGNAALAQYMTMASALGFCLASRTRR